MIPRFLCLSHRYIQIGKDKWECYNCKATKEKIGDLIEYRYANESPVHPTVWGKLYLLKKLKEVREK